MAFDLRQLTLLGNIGSRFAKSWTYTSNDDSIGTILTSNYMLEANSIVKYGDKVWIVGADGIFDAYFSAVTANVVTISSAASGGVGFPTGTVIGSFTDLTAYGFLLMRYGSIGAEASGASIRANADCANLYMNLWNRCSQWACPVDGGRGITAGQDFTANKAMYLPNISGRSFVSTGSMSDYLRTEYVSDFANSNVIIQGSFANLPFQNYQPVRVLTYDQYPFGLEYDQTYYLVWQTGTTYKLATSIANAFSGTFVSWGSDGDGSQYMYPYQSREVVLSEYFGNNTTQQDLNTLVNHKHTFGYFTVEQYSGGEFQFPIAEATGAFNDTTTTGGNVPLDVSNPSLAIDYYIKL